MKIILNAILAVLLDATKFILQVFALIGGVWGSIWLVYTFTLITIFVVVLLVFLVAVANKIEDIKSSNADKLWLEEQRKIHREYLKGVKDE